MELCFSNIHWLSVVVATVLAFAVGSLWYSPIMFSKIWQKELKLSNEDLKNVNMGKIFGLAFLLNLVSAIFLDLVIGPNSTLLNGLKTALVVSVAFIAAAFAINYLFGQKSLRLYLIDAGYFVVYYAIIGAVLGAW